jgi:secondary thiamine-phosphate synthase enzyme
MISAPNHPIRPGGTTMRFRVRTKGHCDVVDVTDRVAAAVRESGTRDGAALVFVAGSTAAVTTIEYESGVVEDLRDVLERVAPEDADYKHHRRWGDRNGAAHVRSALVGTHFMVPVEDGRPVLGTWQQIVLVDFDERPREREVIVKTFASGAG